ncbi:MAG TPA: DUF1425 domain-containing protein [Candidatus Brocadiaceae bacterium]
MTKKNIVLVLVCFFSCMVFFPSCSTVNTVERETPTGTRQPIADKRIITDVTLNRKVSIVGLNEGATNGGFLQIQIEVLNLRNSMQEFSYNIEWFDKNGMLVSSPSIVWIPKQIEGRETMTITAVAPATTVKDFRIKLIENVR